MPGRHGIATELIAVGLRWVMLCSRFPANSLFDVRLRSGSAAESQEESEDYGLMPG